ncbi:LysR family transcriptional regulator [Myroides phaeus]|uniref:LysR family transcriptional regulator, hydrogen peroxide-inducible genes activator n=1 Tax=Myroides phaeus TaxID=702745 RepID=A0A1G8GK47_9FLAO|nr:hydrogen peroxide-inducible genes activator [Myroides phaeus]MEC4115889.1 LysR substrate-binding domain-containing protein [Myroides phaeus]SDH94785.1 LysR family transcriptional regulator, hydrogen peroxide-inducible genes activator [Myroides phaeus]
MTITQLIYVLAVAEHKNFTLAAEKTFVTQPTLSMQIQKLEEELEIQIFDRTTKPIQATAIGQIIIEQAQKIVDESDRIKDLIDQEKGFIGGEFKLGIIPTVAPTLLPMFLKTFLNKHDKVNLIIEEYTTDEIIQKLRTGYLDAAIVATPLVESDIRERVLYYEPFVGYIPPMFRKNIGKELSPDTLDLKKLLLLQDGHCFRDGIINICNNKIETESRNFKLQSGSFETLINLSKEGLGYTLLPYLHTLSLNNDDQANLVQFSDPKPAREISLIYTKNELKKQISDALFDVIQSIIRGAIAFQDVKIISPKKTK